MASRDVNLVIKATDDSSKTVEAIVSALNDFTKGLDNSAKKAEKNTSGFELLGKSLSGIDKVLRGMSDADRLAQSLDRASKGAADLDKSAEAAAAEVKRLGTAVQDAGQKASAFKADLAGVEAALNKEKAALAGNVEAHRKLNTTFTESKAARAQLETQEKNLTATLEKQQTRLTAQQTKLETLTAAFLAAENPTKRLGTSLEAATTAASKTEGAITKTTQALESTRAQITAAGAAEAAYAQQVEGSAAGIVAQRENVSRLADARKVATNAAREAARAEAQLVAAYTGAQDAFASASTGARQAGESLGTLRGNIEAGKAAFAELAKAAQGPLTEALRAQQSIVSRLNNEYQENRKSLAALSATMGAVGVPTREMSDQYDRLNQIQSAIATSFKQQNTVLRDLRGELAATATTTAELAAKEKLFASSLDAGTRALSAARQTVSGAAVETQKLVAANGNAGVSFSKIAQGAREAGQATQDLSQKTDQASEAYKRAANSSRETLSFTQRLKGEVLGLIVAYTGFQGVIDILGRTVKAYQTLEAATSRLNAVNNGDQKAVAADLDFVRRTADKLGIEFGALANQYTKFAAATKGTVIEGQKTRDIFLSIAKAGRVNKLSLDDMNGIFLAVQQIASKGKFQLEELSGQLGERLPGALNILADGLGISTQELLKLTQAGKVSSDRLVEFAAQLDKRYGGALAASLTTTTTAMGQLQNAVFQALVEFGKGGFIEGFTDLIRKLTATLKSADFASFAQSISSGLGTIASAIGLAVENFKLITTVIGGFIGLKLAPVILEWGAAFLGLSSASGGVLGAINAFARAAPAVGVAATEAAAGVTLLSRAMTLLSASNVVGLAITAIGAGIAYWATQTDTSTEALVRNRELVDQVKNSYDDAGHSVEKWAGQFNKLTRSQALANLQATQAAADAARAAAVQPAANSARLRDLSPVGSDARRLLDETVQLSQAFKSGQMDADAYKSALENIYNQTNENQTGLRGLILEQENTADKMKDTNDALQQAKDLWTLVTGTVEQQKEVLDRLNGTHESVVKSTNEADAATDNWNKTLDKIEKIAPKIGTAFEEMKQHLLLDDAYNSAIKFAGSMGEVLRLTKQYNDANAALSAKEADKIFGNASNGLEAARAIIRAKESFAGSAYQDTQGPNNEPGAFRVGFGSDTVTLADGSVQKVVQGMTTSLADANRDLDRRIATYFQQITQQVGPEKFASLTAQQQGVLADLAHNYGSLPKDIAAAVRGGSNEDVAQAILNRRGDNQGINATRRSQEAAAFSADDIDAQNKRYDKQVETQNKANEATRENITLIEEKAKAQDLANDGLTKEAFIAKGVAAEQKKNPRIPQADLDRLKTALGLEYESKQVKKDQTAAVKEAADAATLVNSLMAQRNALEAQLRDQTKSGDATGAADTKTKIEALNGTIGTAITKAKDLYGALGPSDANSAALNRLDAVSTRLGIVATTGNAAATASKAAALESEKVNALLAKRSALEQQLRGQLKVGDTSGAEATKTAIQGINGELNTAIDQAEKMWKAIGGPAADNAVIRLEAARVKAADLKNEAKQNLINWTQVGEMFANGLTGAFDSFAQAVAEGTPIAQAARDAFLKFAADFLINIGKMIIQQELLNLVRSFGGVFSQVGLGASVPTGHTGGRVGSKAIGSGNMSRTVSPALFANAPRFHDGGLPGLKPGEIPSILKTGEEVLKGNDPRNILNGGAAAHPQSQGNSGPPAVRIINSFDTADVVSQGLATVPGEHSIMNVIKTNRSAIRDLINNG